MSMRLGQKFKAIVSDQSGASAVEAAFCFPIIIAAAFACFQYGMFFQNATDVNRNFDTVSRDITLIESPNVSQITEVIEAAIGDTYSNQLTYTVTLVEKYDKSFADIEVLYTYPLSIPFLDDVRLKSHYKNSVMITEEIAASYQNQSQGEG